MSEDDRNLSKDALDLNEYYSFHEQTYKDQDNKMNEEEILMSRENKEYEKMKKNYDKDKKFYYSKDTMKLDNEMVHRDANRDFEKEKRIRKTSADIARETYSGNI